MGIHVSASFSNDAQYQVKKTMNGAVKSSPKMHMVMQQCGKQNQKINSMSSKTCMQI